MDKKIIIGIIILILIFITIVVILIKYNKINVEDNVENNQTLNTTEKEPESIAISELEGQERSKLGIIIAILISVCSLITAIYINNRFKPKSLVIESEEELDIEKVKENIIEYLINNEKLTGYYNEIKGIWESNDIDWKNEKGPFYLGASGEISMMAIEALIFSGKKTGSVVFEIRINQNPEEIRKGKFEKNYGLTMYDYKLPKGNSKFKEKDPELRRLEILSSLGTSPEVARDIVRREAERERFGPGIMPTREEPQSIKPYTFTKLKGGTEK